MKIVGAIRHTYCWHARVAPPWGCVGEAQLGRACMGEDPVPFDGYRRHGAAEPVKRDRIGHLWETACQTRFRRLDSPDGAGEPPPEAAFLRSGRVGRLPPDGGIPELARSFPHFAGS